ncbi:MAG: DegT/DnrJ/EryC1/StrS aminotransferase family protein [Deltaproteobacteria bacterium]|nr:DegT/DnrJ/EryC1/StrS aminotransferase family protein [Deltaproteobacteria bacterium]
MRSVGKLGVPPDRRHLLAVIERRAIRPDGFRRLVEPFPRARDAFQAFMVRVGVPERGGILLPAYIGWSAREGSGVFDPVRALGATFEFYRVTRSLHIDVEDLAQKLNRLKPRVLLLIHYFGYPDPNYRQAAALGREAGAIVVEDEAHALFSDQVGFACGRAGEAALFSLHKMLPVDSGGLLLLNGARWRTETSDKAPGAEYARALGQYDLAAIAQRRLENARALSTLLSPLAQFLEPLRHESQPGVVPQTFPVTLKKAPRDEIYEQMNRAGFGVVSLYHTMVDAISAEAFPESHWLARRVLNLPVHQDASPDALVEMVGCLRRLLESYH